MLTIFYRRFYILLFLVWLGAASGMFILSVWGNFDTFINDFKMIVKMGAGNATNGTGDGEAAVIQVVDKAGEAVRREVVREVRTMEKDVDRVFGDNASAAKPVFNPIQREIKADLAANRTVAASAQAPAAGDVGELTVIDFTHTPEQFLARLTTTEKVGRVTYFWMDKPARLVVDMRGKWTYSTRRETGFVDGFIGLFVLGGHPDRLRMVFFFNDQNATKGKAPELIRTPEGLDIVVADPAKGVQ
ncbi:hypothetical protein [Maridesulfovibrio sp. FT414]|uniref:hypothetical protein n=1 Tax=Maridesulfovibrio sp. FT414 TaxID=2979469 RepID=UPI003D80639D